MNPIHVAITRRVKPGQEAAFEAALLEFMGTTMASPGVLGAQLLRPAPGSAVPEYGILRAFESEMARDAFYASPLFRSWEERVAPLVEGPYELRNLHGLEAFFHQGALRPARWKMALLTWLAVFPAAYCWSQLLRPLVAPLPGMVGSAVVSIFVVVTLAWGLMPVLTRIFESWLLGSKQKQG